MVVVDGIFSNFLISQGLGWEWNPLLKGVAGSEQMLLIKACGVILAIVLLWSAYRKRPVLAAMGAFCSLIFYAVIIYWNLFGFTLTIHGSVI